MSDTVRDHLKARATWIRLLYMILFGVIFNFTQMIIFLVVIVQFLFKLFSGQVNRQLQTLGQGLGLYAFEIISFLTFATDDLPFPFRAWPSKLPGDTHPVEPAATQPTRAEDE